MAILWANNCHQIVLRFLLEWLLLGPLASWAFVAISLLYGKAEFDSIMLANSLIIYALTVCIAHPKPKQISRQITNSKWYKPFDVVAGLARYTLLAVSALMVIATTMETLEVTKLSLPQWSIYGCAFLALLGFILGLGTTAMSKQVIK